MTEPWSGRGYDTLDALRAVWGSSDAETKRYWDNWASYIGSGLPVIGGFIKSRDNWNYINDYMRNTGLTWSDVKYPSRVDGASTAGYGLNFVSSNIEDLYKDDEKMRMMNYDYNVYRLRRYMW